MTAQFRAKEIYFHTPDEKEKQPFTFGREQKLLAGPMIYLSTAGQKASYINLSNPLFI